MRVEISPSHEKITRRAVQQVRAQLSPTPQAASPAYAPLTFEVLDDDGATYTQHYFVLDLDELDDPQAVLG